MLQSQTAELEAMLAPLSDSQGDFAYAEGKWSIKEVLQHVIDGERVFAYRLLRISRGDATPLHGYDHDAYARSAGAKRRTLWDIVTEFAVLRESSLALIRSIPTEAWNYLGNANNVDVRARAIPFIMAGHVRHHLNVLRQQYFTSM